MSVSAPHQKAVSFKYTRHVADKAFANMSILMIGLCKTALYREDLLVCLFLERKRIFPKGPIVKQIDFMDKITNQINSYKFQVKEDEDDEFEEINDCK